MYRVALNTAIAGLKRNDRRPATTSIEGREYDFGYTMGATAHDENLQKMFTAISRLSEVEKALVTLYLEEKTYAEIEEIMGINTNNLRVKMNRLKEKLKRLMKDMP